MSLQRRWQRPLDSSVVAACNSGEIRLKVFVHDERASMRMITFGRKSAWPFLRDAPGWAWQPELQAYVCIDFDEDVRAIDLVAVGALGVKRVNASLVLTNGFIGMQRDLDDVLAGAAVRMVDGWRLLSDRHFEASHRAIVEALREQVDAVAARKRRLQERTLQAEKEAAAAVQREERRAATAQTRWGEMQCRLQRPPSNASEHAKYMFELKRIGEFMADKPLSPHDWTAEMHRASARSNVDLAVMRCGNDAWVCPVYPDPPEWEVDTRDSPERPPAPPPATPPATGGGLGDATDDDEDAWF